MTGSRGESACAACFEGSGRVAGRETGVPGLEETGVADLEEAGLFAVAGSLALFSGEGRAAGTPRVLEVGVCGRESSEAGEEALESREVQLAGLAGREVSGRGERARRARASIRSLDTGEEPRRWASRERMGPSGGFPSLWVMPGLAFNKAALRARGADLGSLQVGSGHTGLRGKAGLPLGVWRSFCLEEVAALCTGGVATVGVGGAVGWGAAAFLWTSAGDCGVLLGDDGVP